MVGQVTQGTPPTAEELDWGPVLEHLPWLCEPDPEVGRMVASELQEDGSWSWPYEALSPRAEELVEQLHTSGVVAGALDWSRWLDTRGDELVRDRDGSAIAEASLEDCRRLLVTLVRQSRFVEGTMLDALRSGRVRWTLERVSQLTGSGPTTDGAATNGAGTNGAGTNGSGS
jgi:hypothetical protein